MKRVRRLLRLYLDIPALLVLAVLLWGGWQFVTQVYSHYSSDADQFGQTLLGQLVFGIVTSAITALVLAAVGFVVFKWVKKSDVAGTFDAFDVGENGDVPWGKITLRYNPFSNSMRGTVTHGDTELQVDAKLFREQYLRGHYVEISNLARRRFGAFMMSLDGDGKSFEGKYVFVSPSDGYHVPSCGDVRWDRVEE